MSIQLGENSYGESGVRLLRVVKQEGRHDVKEMILDIRFEGDFEEAHAKGENRTILPPDTMKNTVYVLARQYPVEAIEEFCLHAIDHFLTYNPQVSRVEMEAAERLWARVPHGGKPHPSTFMRAGDEQRTAQLSATRKATTIRGGIDNLVLLKTNKPAFENFMRDPYTTLEEDAQGILSASLRANWLYEGEEIEYGPIWHGVRQALLENFAEHDGRSLQHTLYAMGEAVLSNFDSIREICLCLADKHYRLADLAPFGMDNPAQVFLPSDEPHGLIEAKLRKD
jgi:urate oxidase